MALFFVKDNADKVLWGKEPGSLTPLSAYQSFISGALAGAAGPLVSAPMDIVKTRFQSIDGVNGTYKYTGIHNAVTSIAKEEGLKTLWRGLLPRVMRLALGQAVTWTVTDKIIAFMVSKQ